MNILNKQIDSIYDRQKKYPHYSQQNAESVMYWIACPLDIAK